MLIFQIKRITSREKWFNNVVTFFFFFFWKMPKLWVGRTTLNGEKKEDGLKQTNKKWATINESYDASSQSKPRNHCDRFATFFAVFVKESRCRFQSPNHGWKHRNNQEFVNFSIFSAREEELQTISFIELSFLVLLQVLKTQMASGLNETFPLAVYCLFTCDISSTIASLELSCSEYECTGITLESLALKLTAGSISAK